MIVPTGVVEADPSNLVAAPELATAAENDAVGAWSGVIAIPSGWVPTVISVPAVFVATLIGVTELLLKFAT